MSQRKDKMTLSHKGCGAHVRPSHGHRLHLAFLAVFGLLLFWTTACTSATGQTAEASTDGGSGRAIQNKGSDTLVNLALAWAERYRVVKPDVAIAVTGDGITPVEFTVAIDALAVIVNPANPISQLTIDQLADIYTGRITNWQEVGGNDAPIILLSRETNSGTHVYFLEEVVRKGDGDNEDIFAPQTLLMPSSVGITSELRRNPNAIGYDGFGYVDPEHEKLIAVAVDADSPYVLPSVATGTDGSYPIARALYMYTAGEPTGVIRDYLDWIAGPEGQTIVAELGFVPLPKE
jgi:phosphate transport system substrate-binding protein